MHKPKIISKLKYILFNYKVGKMLNFAKKIKLRQISLKLSRIKLLSKVYCYFRGVRDVIYHSSSLNLIVNSHIYNIIINWRGRLAVRGRR